MELFLNCMGHFTIQLVLYIVLILSIVVKSFILKLPKISKDKIKERITLKYQTIT